MKLLVLVFGLLPLAAQADELKSDRPEILVLGDSLSTGYGLPAEQGWVHLLNMRLAASNLDYRVVNASVSGDTTSGALNRLNGILERMTPDVALVELGGNDGLRGLHPREIRANLAAIIQKLTDVGATVVLVPMKIPPNYGPVYNEKFESLYRELAMRDGVILSRFILRDIAEHPALMQADGIHPVAEAQPVMLENVWESLLEAIQAERVAGELVEN